MKKDDWDFMERTTLDLQAHHAACKILEVTESVNKKDLIKAYRKASLKYHPDYNQDDPDANKKFILIKCAYELLAEDKSCPTLLAILLEKIGSWSGVPEDSKYDISNPWGHFLWWREKFFDSEKTKENLNGKHSSCI